MGDRRNGGARTPTYNDAFFALCTTPRRLSEDVREQQLVINTVWLTQANVRYIMALEPKTATDIPELNC